jgi:tRNA pseudouridine38-40 synthase
VRIALGLEYDGTGYAGWQVQSHAPSVQGALNVAIAAVADHPVSTLAAGRTDAGVHAADIAVRWVRPVAADFHARHSAVARTYEYLVWCAPVRPALARHRVWWVREPLDLSAMVGGAATLLGEHDFSSFRGAGCQARSPVRRLHELAVHGLPGGLRVVARASGFLHHMVRNLVGALVAVGAGERAPGDLARLLAARDRRLAPPTAPAAGLYLAAVEYPAHCGLPASTPPPGAFPGLGIIPP